MIPSASYPGKKTSLNQFSKYIPPSEKKTGLRPSWFLCCCSGLGRHSRPAWQLSYEADKSIKWNKNLKKFVKTQGHNLKMSFLRPNLWIGLGFWMEKQILLWILTCIVLTNFFEKERKNFLTVNLVLLSRQGQRASHCHLTKKLKIESSVILSFYSSRYFRNDSYVSLFAKYV